MQFCVSAILRLPENINIRGIMGRCGYISQVRNCRLCELSSIEKNSFLGISNPIQINKRGSIVSYQKKVNFVCCPQNLQLKFTQSNKLLMDNFEFQIMF